jgi:predicted permease
VFFDPKKLKEKEKSLILNLML